MCQCVDASECPMENEGCVDESCIKGNIIILLLRAGFWKIVLLSRWHLVSRICVIFSLCACSQSGKVGCFGGLRFGGLSNLMAVVSGTFRRRIGNRILTLFSIRHVCSPPPSTSGYHNSITPFAWKCINIE